MSDASRVWWQEMKKSGEVGSQRINVAGLASMLDNTVESVVELLDKYSSLLTFLSFAHSHSLHSLTHIHLTELISHSLNPFYHSYIDSRAHLFTHHCRGSTPVWCTVNQTT